MPDLQKTMDRATHDDVVAAIHREHLTLSDLAALVSPRGAEHLEAIARRSVSITRQRFGNAITMYAPIYLSNECSNTCLYCGFSRDNDIVRRTLSAGEATRELDALRAHGFGHVLLLTGEHRGACPVEYLETMVGLAARRFHSVSIEVYPMTQAEYGRMVDAGCDGLTLYQETFDPEVYRIMHGTGPKKNYAKRLDSPGFGAAAGMRSVGIGFLLGLADWRLEALYLALQARHIMHNWWRSRISISFPRLRQCASGFQPLQTVTDRDMVQMMTAMRLFLPDADLVLSTRESPKLRDNLIPLGITRISAGSKTDPGGYAIHDGAGQQFSISDERPPEEIAALIESKGFEVVWKDFDRAFMD